MLIKTLLEADRFETDLLPTVTVNSLQPESAANDSRNDRKNMQARRVRRQSRQSRSMTNHVGGWKVRMW